MCSITLVAPWHGAALRVGLEKAGGRVAGSAECWELSVARWLSVSGDVRMTADGELSVARSAPLGGPR